MEWPYEVGTNREKVIHNTLRPEQNTSILQTIWVSLSPIILNKISLTTVPIEVSIASGNGLVPNRWRKPLPEPVITHIEDTIYGIIRPQWVEHHISLWSRSICLVWTTRKIFDHIYFPEPHWWEVDIGSDNGLVPSFNKPLSELMLTQIYGAVCITGPQWVNIHGLWNRL